MLILPEIYVKSPNQEIGKQLSSHMESNRYLRQLSVSGFTSIEDAEYVAGGIAASASLTSINLTTTTILQTFKRLSSTTIRLGDEGAKRIAKGIAVSTSLTKVLAFC